MPAARCGNQAIYAAGRKLDPNKDLSLPDDTPVRTTERAAALVDGVVLKSLAPGTPLRLATGGSVVWDPDTAFGRAGRNAAAAYVASAGSKRAAATPANILPSLTPEARAERGARHSALVGIYRLDPEGRPEILHVRTKKAPAGWQTVGGGIDAGESAAQAAIREVAEETGWQIDQAELIPVTVVPSDLSQGTMTYFLAPAPARDVAPNLPEDELLEHRWAPFDTAHDLPMFAAGHTFLERAENILATVQPQ